MAVSGADDTRSGIASELSAFQQQILPLLLDEARYGMAIKRELDAYYGSEVNPGRLYPNLDALVEMGLVEKRASDRRTNEYALTGAGHDAIMTQLSWMISRVVTSEARAAELKELIPAAQQ